MHRNLFCPRDRADRAEGAGHSILLLIPAFPKIFIAVIQCVHGQEKVNQRGALNLPSGCEQEDVDLDEWLGSSRPEPEVRLLSQKLLRKLGLDGAGKSDAVDTKTSADDSADDEPGGDALLESGQSPHDQDNYLQAL